MSETHCETCCIRDMIECALELIDCGYDEWDLVDKYTRNHLTEQQFTYGGFVAVDNSKEDLPDKTWKNLDKRIIGGWSGRRRGEFTFHYKIQKYCRLLRRNCAAGIVCCMGKNYRKEG